MIVLVKHAQPVLDGSRPAREWRLSPEGEEQARRLARELRRFAPFRLASSPEPKAARTAEIVATELGVSLALVDGLRELDRPALPIMSAEEHERLNARLFADFDAPVIGSESARDALDRFSRAVADLAAQDPASNLVAVAHGTVIALLVGARGGMDARLVWKRLQCPSFVVLDTPSLALREIVDRIP